jgi:hypothetical protein
MMKYLVMLDNGQDYSDFRTYPSLVCNSEESAKVALRMWNAWKKKAFTDPEIFYFDEMRGAPLPPFGPHECVTRNFCVSYIPVPDHLQPLPLQNPVWE